MQLLTCSRHFGSGDGGGSMCASINCSQMYNLMDMSAYYMKSAKSCWVCEKGV